MLDFVVVFRYFTSADLLTITQDDVVGSILYGIPTQVTMLSSTVASRFLMPFSAET